MEQLWAPWRSAYVQAVGEKHEQQTCFLCDAGSALEPDSNALVVGCSAHGVVLLNRFPYTSGHLMVVPRKHTASILGLNQDEYADVMGLLQRSLKVVDAVYAPHGCNVGMNIGAAAGAGMPDHLHIHVVPRWNGDTNFMPVLAHTGVISEDLEVTWHKLSHHFTLL
jgi:ATP adenylyltransferase